MKKILLTVGFGLALLANQESFAQQGFGTNDPDRSAAVDIVSTKRGLLVPRIALTATNLPGPVANPANALFVYNTATTTGPNLVQPGFYYWERDNIANPTPGKWVRFISSNLEKTVIVEEGNNVKVDVDNTILNTTKYTVSVQGGTDGQVLVTEVVGGNTSTRWINPEVFVKDVVNAENGLTYVPSTGPGVDNIFKLGGSLGEPTKITTVGSNTLTIEGLAAVTPTATDFIMIMDADGMLKKTSVANLLGAEDLTLESQLEFTNGTDGQGAVLKETKIGIKDGSIGAKKLDPGVSIVGQVATIVDNSGTTEVQYRDAATAFGRTLNGAGITVTAGATEGNDLSVANSILTEVTLGIAEDAITSDKIKDGEVKNVDLGAGSVSPDKMTSFTSTNGTTAAAAVGTVPVANGSGGVTYQNVATAIGKTLTTDGKIVIGASNLSTLANAVLVDTELKIKALSIGTTELSEDAVTNTKLADNAVQTENIANGTITTDDIASTGNSKVLVTAADGVVSWINQSELGNKDSYNGVTPISIVQNGTSVNGLNYDVSVAEANGTAPGVVKQAALAPTVDITNGVLAVNVANTVLAGEVTGPLNATIVADDVIDAANLKTDAVETAKIKNNAVTPAKIQPGDTAGKILATTGTNPNLVTSWVTPNSLVAVDNGLRKVTDDVIHLGGTLIEPTTIITGSANTLAITNLTEVAVANKVVVAETAGGVLRTVTKSLSQSITANLTVNSTTITGYSAYVQDINISATIGTADIDVTLPVASVENIGQAINIKVANTSEPNFYLNIKTSTGTVLTYGSMPFQGWILKSNGSAWVVVGRN